jgi:ligand-binding sensor domain-containing protein/two-component sensor histidine kinase
MYSLNLVSDFKKHNLLLIPAIRQLSFFILFILAFSFSYSQQKPFRIYTVNDGLISNAPQQIFQDSDGFIWIGSNEGMSIYDGSRFLNYTRENNGLSDNIVNHFFQKDKNEVWVLHSNGIDVFIKRKFKETLPVKGIGFMMWTRDHRILATGTNGIYEFIDDKPDLVFSSPKQFYGLIEIGNFFLANEIPWEGTVLIDHSFHVVDSFMHHGTFLKDRSHCWWYGNKISLLDENALQKGSIRLLPAPFYLNQINDGHISYPFTDSDGFIWVSSDKGVIRIDKQGKIKKFNLSNGLNNNWTSAFFEDAEGNIWAQGSGYIKFFSKYIDVFSTNEGLSPQAVASIDEDSHHNAWIAQASNISCIYQNKIYKFDNPGFNKNGASFPRILIRGDSLWMAFFGLRLFRIHYDPQPHLQLIKQWLSYHQKKLIFASDNLCCYGDGCILVNFDDGLFQVTKNKVIHKIGDINFFKFLISGDEIWSGPVTEGVIRWKIIPAKDSIRLQFMKKYDDLPGSRVLSMAKDKAGNFWMGTYYKGVLEFEKQKNDSFHLRSYDIENGLPSNLVYKIFFDHSGRLFINTSRGLCLLHRMGDSISFENLSHRYGFVEDIIDITGNDKSDLWLSAEAAAIRINNDQHQKNLPPKIFITGVLYNNQPDTLINDKFSTRSFSHTQNNLEFEFSSTAFRNEDQVLYSYQMQSDKSDSNWSEPQKIHKLSFASLSPGHYTFKVKALTAENVWSMTPAEYSFIIRSPYYETWWFRLLIVFILAGIFLILYWYRLRQLKKLFSLRTKISRDLHDEIGSTLSGIGLMSEMAKQQLDNEKHKEARKSLDKISDNSEEMLGKMSDIVWAINPQNDTFEKMMGRLRDYSKYLTATRGINLHFESGKELQRNNLNMQQRKNIYLICKEAINNAVKYADCHNLKFTFENNDHHFNIFIQDDGKGFNTQTDFEGNGLKNMRSRAEEIKARLEIYSEENKGTDIKLSGKIT